MALPKKGSRKITVDGIVYRWRGYTTRYEGDDYGELFVERFDEPRQKIKATFTWTKLHQEYKKVGQKLQGVFDHPPPHVVRESILYALEHGWHPEEGGGTLDLGNLDEKLPFDLKPQ